MRKLFRVAKRLVTNLICLMKIDLMAEKNVLYDFIQKINDTIDSTNIRIGNISIKRISAVVEHKFAITEMERNSHKFTECAIDETSDLIVSLTTHGDLIREVHLAIESLMEQTYKPKKIILWISDAYKDFEIPFVLRKMQTRGLEIKKTKDILSYTKLIPALLAYHESPIATFDDDTIYPPDALENLYRAYKNNPSMIYFRRGHRMKLNGENEFTRYRDFEWEIKDSDIDIMNFPTGVGGVLYPPHCFDDEVMNENAFKKLCPTADDVWFKAMAVKKGILSRKVWTGKIPYIELDWLHENNNLKLNSLNTLKDKNDEQIKAVWGTYDLWKNMKISMGGGG